MQLSPLAVDRCFKDVNHQVALWYAQQLRLLQCLFGRLVLSQLDLSGGLWRITGGSYHNTALWGGA